MCLWHSHCYAKWARATVLFFWQPDYIWLFSVPLGCQWLRLNLGNTEICSQGAFRTGKFNIRMKTSEFTFGGFLAVSAIGYFSPLNWKKEQMKISLDNFHKFIEFLLKFNILPISARSNWFWYEFNKCQYFKRFPSKIQTIQTLTHTWTKFIFKMRLYIYIWNTRGTLISKKIILTP